MYSQALDETNYEYGTLANDKWISSHIPLSLRSENLTPTHARVLASLEPLEIETWANEIAKSLPFSVCTENSITVA